MKKGFTLVELLAVIVILAVILAIAVPSIANLIDNAKINAFISDEKLMIKAVKTYLGINSNYLPSNIGQSSEVTLSTLQANNYIGTITSPSDKSKTCNGYVLITKIDASNYDYNPFLNCENAISNSIEDGLMAHWKLDGNVYDYSLNNNHGTIFGASFSSNRFNIENKSIYFNGINNYISVPNSVSLNPSSITIMMWIYISGDLDCDANNNWRSLLFKGNASSTGNGYDLILEQNRSIAWDTGSGTSDRWWPANFIIPIGSWTHVAFTYNAGESKKVYLNGQLKDTKVITASNLTANTNDLIISASSTACSVGYGSLLGDIDDIRIYNRALTTDEIKNIYDIEKRTNY